MLDALRGATPSGCSTSGGEKRPLGALASTMRVRTTPFASSSTCKRSGGCAVNTEWCSAPVNSCDELETESAVSAHQPADAGAGAACRGENECV